MEAFWCEVVAKIPLKSHVKLHVEKSDPELVKRSDDFLNPSRGDAQGGVEGEGLVRSITEDFGDRF